MKVLFFVTDLYIMVYLPLFYADLSFNTTKATDYRPNEKLRHERRARVSFCDLNSP